MIDVQNFHVNRLAKIFRAVIGCVMTHNHALIIERIGREIVREHFRCTVRTIQNWCVDGIPRRYHKTFVLLGASWEELQT